MSEYLIGNKTCRPGQRVRIQGQHVGNRNGLEATIQETVPGRPVTKGFVPVEIHDPRYAGFLFLERVENLQLIEESQ